MRRAISRVNERPVFILGNQKSGTSAIVNLLGAATGKSFTNDVFCWFADAETRILKGELTWDCFVDRARFYFSRELVKEPGFTFLLDALSNRFPRARFVFVVRHPYTNIRGILSRLNLPGDLESLTPTHFDSVTRRFPLWMPVLSGLSGNCAGDTYIATLANRCAKALSICNAKQERWVIVRYEDFLADKVRSIDRIAAALGLDVVKDIKALKDKPFQAPSAVRANPLDFFGRRNLARITEICAGPMADFDYKAAP